MKKKRTLLRLVMISLFFFLAPALCCAETTTVEVEGVGFAVAKNTASARDKAINDARLRAIEQVLGVEVDSKTIIHNSLLVDDTLINTSHGMVKKYEILGEGWDKHGLYRVRIKAMVDKEELTMSLQQAAGERRILLVSPEAEAQDSNGVLERVIHAFVEAGFPLLPMNCRPVSFICRIEKLFNCWQNRTTVIWYWH